MALKDLFGYLDDKLEEVFNTKPHDPVKARRPLLNGIAATKDQFEAGRTKVPNRWWSVSNDVVAFSPKVHKLPLVINGKTTNFIPSERFVEFLATFKEHVEAGEFDGVIASISAGGSNAGSSVPVSVPAKRVRGPMSEEGKANIRAGRARARAAREAANV